MIEILDKGTTRNIIKRKGITMDTIYLELYEDWMFKTGKIKRPNNLEVLFSNISNYELLDAHDGKYLVTYHYLEPNGVRKQVFKMKLERGNLYISEPNLEYFKYILAAKKVINF